MKCVKLVTVEIVVIDRGASSADVAVSAGVARGAAAPPRG